MRLRARKPQIIIMVREIVRSVVRTDSRGVRIHTNTKTIEVENILRFPGRQRTRHPVQKHGMEKVAERCGDVLDNLTALYLDACAITPCL